ncbi:MAG: type IX secretion system outer membrane channel protein PorV [Saprospiraceae bacterium]|nr:type IX secretion system outer membrane channel protein PorV [Saprospiraceae bacterium]MCB0626111.1 type IX secretion system outer membrane channel protein PorV [Saprospiraceae bacterium]MCB0678751.1 type IX secretion system outer membrane channel protein PorV [Saprospiraceae bacterium]MCB0679497.1 type IX secretion system outer membrane channel protein PorV [Saprospiraceae bacterium]
MKNSLLTALVALLVLAAIDVRAQIATCLKNTNGEWVLPDGSPCPNSIITAVPFLRIVSDARSAALGDAGIAISPDANALHFNDSKLVFAEQDLGISATYTPWLRELGLNDVYIAYLTGFYKISDLQAVGLGLRYFSLGEINFTDINGEPLGNGRPNEFELKGSYARKLSDHFAAAIGAKFIYSNLASGQTVNGQEITVGTAGAADVSFTYSGPLKMQNMESNLTVGLALSNIGSKITYTNAANNERDFIPANLGIGAAWELNFDEFNSLTIVTDINKFLVPTPCLEDCDPGQNGIPDWKEESPIGGIFSSFGDAPGGFSEELQELMFSFGLEYWYDKQFAVRAGYYFEDQTKGARRFFTVGLGLKYNIFGLNFSYLVPTTNQRNPLDNTLRFSLLFDFGAFEKDAGN